MTCSECGRDNPDGFRFCGFCGAPLGDAPPAAASSERPAGGEERRIVTILFCDLVGFTARSDRADPEDIKDRLRPFHTRLKEAIEAYGGTLDKFIGDAALGVFGSPVAHEDDAERAVRAGLAILEGIAELNRADPALELAVRIGINTGEAVVAFGTGPQIGEAVTGDVVNTASRLQSVAPVGGIVVGEATFRATREVFVYEPMDAVTVKGKAEPLEIWRAVAARGRFGADFTRRHTTRLVGREAELARLREAYARAVGEARVQLVTIVAEPGVGKSRLVAELSNRIDGLPEMVTWRQGRCLPYGEGITFWALGEIVKAHAGILESDSPTDALAKLDAVIARGEPDRVWLRERLAPLVGIEAASTAVRTEAFTAWRRFLESFAAGGPAVLVVEDLHWADAALIEFLAEFVAVSQGAPILLVCTARPELFDAHPEWGSAADNAATISLAPLSAEETAGLLSALLDRSELPADVRTLLLERAGGNPLYAEEFVRMLKDQRALVRTGDAWTLAEGAEVRFPDSLQSLIAARLDALAVPTKAFLQDAAVVGKVFWAGAVQGIGRCDDDAAARALDELHRKELVRTAPESTVAGEREYVFWHALVREVAYAQIPRAARARKHGAAARWLERTAGERVEDVAEVLAHHYTTALELTRVAGPPEECAVLEGPALRFLGLAGDRALGLDVTRAETTYARALVLAGPDHAERPGLLVRWADALRQESRFAEGEAAFEEAIAAFARRGDRLAAARAMGALSSLLLIVGDARQEPVALEAVALLESEPPGPDLVAAYARMAGVKLVLGSPRETIEWVDRAEALAVRLGVPLPARALGFRGYARSSLGDADGLADMRAALAMAIEGGEGRDGAVLYNNLAVAVMPIEGPRGTLDACREGVEFSERRGITEMVLAIQACSLDPLVEAGDWDRALELAREVEERAESTGDVADVLQSRWAQARVRTGRGEAAAAVALADLVVETVRQSGAAEDVVAGYSCAAAAYLSAGRPGDAHELVDQIDRTPNVREIPAYPVHLCEMVRTAVGVGDVELAARLASGFEPVFAYHRHALRAVEAIVLEARGELEAAAARADEAAEGWRGFGVRGELGHALLVRARSLLGLGRTEEAAAPLAEARALFVDLGAAPAVAEADRLRGT